jgi:putative transcriptional regulator
MAVRILIDRLLVERGLSVGEFASAIGITPANVAVLKNGRARAIRFLHSTKSAACSIANPGTYCAGKGLNRPN